MSKAKKRGRPQGSKNVTDVGEVAPSRCKCGSSRKKSCKLVNRKEFVGAGLPYLAIRYYRVECLDCSQVRRDRVPEYAPEKK